MLYVFLILQAWQTLSCEYNREKGSSEFRISKFEGRQRTSELRPGFPFQQLCTNIKTKMSTTNFDSSKCWVLKGGVEDLFSFFVYFSKESWLEVSGLPAGPVRGCCVIPLAWRGPGEAQTTTVFDTNKHSSQHWPLFGQNVNFVMGIDVKKLEVNLRRNKFAFAGSNVSPEGWRFDPP